MRSVDEPIEYVVLPAVPGTVLIELSIARGYPGEDEEDQEDGPPPVAIEEYQIVGWRVPLHRGDVESGAEMLAITVGREEEAVPSHVRPYEGYYAFHVTACVMPGGRVCADGHFVQRNEFLESATKKLQAARAHRLASFKDDFDLF